MAISDGAVVYSGFDSAWTATNVGAIASIRQLGQELDLVVPEPAMFDEACSILERHRATAPLHIVAADEPLIVSNQTGRRPVEEAVSHAVGRYGGGVQPANRDRVGMFDDAAPIWTFLEEFGGDLNPTNAATASAGRFVVEVFPALGNLGLFSRYFDRGAMPKYNPERRKTFSLADWGQLCRDVGAQFDALGIRSGVEWCARAAALNAPRKCDQDQLDALICALHAYRWRTRGTRESAIVGDMKSGYMLIPVHQALATELKADAQMHDVPFSYDEPG